MCCLYRIVFESGVSYSAFSFLFSILRDNISHSSCCFSSGFYRIDLHPSARQSVRMDILTLTPGAHSIDTFTWTDVQTGYSMDLWYVAPLPLLSPFPSFPSVPLLSSITPILRDRKFVVGFERCDSNLVTMTDVYVLELRVFPKGVNGMVGKVGDEDDDGADLI